MGPDGSEFIEKLWDISIDDPSREVREQACMAISAIEIDQSNIISRINTLLELNDTDSRLSVLSNLHYFGLPERENESLLESLWALFSQEEAASMEAEILSAIVLVSPDEDHLCRRFFSLNKISQGKRGRLLMSSAMRETAHRFSLRYPVEVIPVLIGIVIDGTQSDRQEAMNWLAEMASDFPEEWKRDVQDALWQSITYYGQGFKVYCLISGREAALSRLIHDPAIAQEFVGCILLTEAPPDLLQSYYVKNENSCLAYIIEALVHPDWTVRVGAADWLCENSANLPSDSYKQVTSALKLRIRKDSEPAVKRSAGSALAALIQKRQLTRQLRRGKLIKLVKDKSADHDAKLEAIASLAGINSREVMSAIVNEWLDWIAAGHNILLIDLAADILRRSSFSVLPLVKRLDRSPDSETVPISSSGDNPTVRRHIVHLLAEMSEERFFESDFELFESISAELHRHAVPILAENLDEESDIEIREYTARLLTNVGGREAVAALTRVITGDERTRLFRQELLATYYLDPSKARGEQASQILQEALGEAQRSMRLYQGLNVTVFVAGLIMLAAGLIASFFGHESATKILGTMTALGALGGLIVQLIHDPLERIQRSIANLVQIETAFTSFIWELNLNNTYIQSQYVANGKLSDDSIESTIRRIDESLNMTMNLVSLFTGGQDRAADCD
jgi:hypothetical protein